MSLLDRGPDTVVRGGTAGVPAGPVHEVVAGREATLGPGMTVRRVLPTLGRRLVGAWCFADHYGPQDVVATSGMQVPPHPHIGLQTVSWLLEGSVRHQDSLGNDQLIQPGQLGLMTAGSAIAHAEHSPVAHPALLHGVQLWVALPEGARHGAPAWEHHAAQPVVTEPGGTATLIVGELDGVRSPATMHTPIVGADVALAGELRLPLEPDFEYAAMVMSGSPTVDGAALTSGSLLYLGTGRRDLHLRGAGRVLLLGGLPFAEPIVMWWNFVARDHDEIAQARAAWVDGARFAEVPGQAGRRQEAPALPPGRLRPSR